MPRSTGNARPPDGHGRSASDDPVVRPEARAEADDDNLTSLGNLNSLDDLDGTVLPTTPRTPPVRQPAADDATRFEPADDATRFEPADDATRHGPADDATRYEPATDATRFEPADDVTRYDPAAPRAPRPSTQRGLVPPPASPSTDHSHGTGGRRADGDDQGPLVVGQAFGPRYKITRVLGVGGMGAVYQAWDAELGVDVAVKVIRPEIAADPDAASEIERRFKRELLLARQVTHPNIIRIHDLGDIDGIKYITMPFIDGSDLATILKQEKKLGVPRALLIARGTVSGLVSAHEAGVIHRDLKPANIMIGWDDAPTIMDFGIARSAGGPGQGPAPRAMSLRPSDLSRTSALAASSTMAGAIVGTVAYMAPEQARGEEVDQRADIYAFGLILYDMIIGGRRSERAPSAIAELQQRMQTAPPAPRTIDPTIPEAVDEIIRRCLEPDAANRFQTTVELQHALDRLDEEGKPLPIVRRLTKRMAATAAAIVLAMVAGTWWLARGPAPVVEIPPMSVLVADFDNQSGDPVFTGALEHTLGVALEGASFVNLYSRVDAQRLVERLKPGGRVDEQMARVLSRREKIDVILAGSIVPERSGYRISVTAIDPAREDGKPISTVSTTASGKDEVLPALNVLGARIRGPLGDTTPESVRLAAAETFTTSSPEAVKSFDSAQELLFAGRTEEALNGFKRATEHDPNFARAWSSAAVAAGQLGREQESEELWKKALSLVDRVTERERYRMLGTYSYTAGQNPERAIDNFKTLVEKYPADRVGTASLALAYFWALKMPEALEAGRHAVDLNPDDVIVRANYGLYAMYAGDFPTAVEQMKLVTEQNPQIGAAYLPMAMAALVRGDAAEALRVYEQMAATGGAAASLASMGRADVALYRGRYADAAAILREAIAAHETGGHPAALAFKHIALAEAYVGLGQTAAAAAAARQALAATDDDKLQALAAIALVRAGQARDARPVIERLSQQLAPQSRAYAHILNGHVALRERRLVDAVDAFTAAQQLADLWLARYGLGVTYVQARHFAEALNELAQCEKRQGEATAVLLDETPTFRYYAAVPYFKARAQEELGQLEAAAEGYKTYIAVRGEASSDPLLADAQKRLKAIAPAP